MSYRLSKTDHTIWGSFESCVELELNLARDTSGQFAQTNVKEDNNMKQMVIAGSKGSFILTDVGECGRMLNSIWLPPQNALSLR